MNRRYQQVDPFNAGDPVMPWDELGDEFVPLDSGGDWTAPHDTSGSAGAQAPSGTDGYPTASYPTTDDEARPASQAGGSPAGTKGRTRKPRTSRARTSAAKAPKPRATQGTAPTRETMRAQAAQSASATKSAGGTRRNVFGRVVGFIALAMLLISMLDAISGCVAVIFDSAGDSESPSSSRSSFGSSDDKGPDFNAINNQLRGQQEQDFTTRLKAIKAGDDAAVKRGAQLLDKQFGVYAGGRTLADVGVNSEDLARWMLASMTYDESDISSALYVSDSSLTDDGYVAVDVTRPYYNSLIYGIYDYADDTYHDQLKAGALSDAAKADVREKLLSIEMSTPQQDMYASVTTHASVNSDGSNAQVTLDEDEWNKQVDELFGA